ncbi:hypothetical protein [Pseudonocardia sp. ICBG601]|uniref:hypothetical protein n=1 Tax=Pseudonocardia sp. ICBG601 TaxID=2846759 RepID=UPI001CF6CD9C|nr:hypothetical protein [Pseudonocardia sp. ICBG601]
MSAYVDAADGLAFVCETCETHYDPDAGECPECGDWMFVAVLRPAAIVPARRLVGEAS